MQRGGAGSRQLLLVDVRTGQRVLLRADVRLLPMRCSVVETTTARDYIDMRVAGAGLGSSQSIAVHDVIRLAWSDQRLQSRQRQHQCQTKELQHQQLGLAVSWL